MAPGNQDFIRLVNVTRRLAGRNAVDRLSLTVSNGEVVALFGPSGCGKTTTLRLIAGLEVPDDGEIWIAGQKVAADGYNYRLPHARRVGFVFQDLALWPHLTIAQSLDFVLEATGLAKPERVKRIDEMLRLAHAETFASRYPAELSGGEQQRAALARALVGHPRLLLLDEPFSNLDSDLKASLLSELSLLQQKLGVTTIYVTHDRYEAALLARRVILMRNGKVENVETSSTSPTRLV